MRRVIFHRLAAAEYLAARRRYAVDSAWAADRCRDEIERAVLRISSNAEHCSPGTHGSRWTRVRRFSYVVQFFILDDSTVQVVAVAHTSRRLGYWRRRLHRP